MITEATKKHEKEKKEDKEDHELRGEERRQDKTRQDKTRQDKREERDQPLRQHKARPVKAIFETSLDHHFRTTPKPNWLRFVGRASCNHAYRDLSRLKSKGQRREVEIY